MADIPVLSPAEVQQHLQELDSWELVDGNRIRKLFTFADFAGAMAFMNRLAPVAEELHHHPEWSNVYNRVTIELTTHEADGLSRYDFDFAKRADELAEV